MELYYWPGDQWNPPEIAHGPNHNDRFYVKALGNRIRQSPRTREFLENPVNGWVKLVPASDNQEA